jgi:succinate dehydrogenase / fumarate reductase, cytochrome b subunit
MSAARPRPSPVRSTIGLKVMMAVTGAALVLFVVQHMVAHLQMFGGRDTYNAYADFMQGLGAVKWGARFGLLAALALHVWAAVALARRNRAARPQAYARLRTRATTWYARTMLLAGVVALVFLVYHLGHFTIGFVHTEHFHDVDTLGRTDIYNNFVLSFQNPVITLVYVVAMIAVSSHLAHGVSSLFRSVAIDRGRLRGPIAKIGPVVGLVTGLGFVLVPLACLFGVIRPIGS